MFLSRKRKGASFLIMVVIMALVMSMFAVSVSQLTRTRSATLISDATEKQVLYLAEDAVNRMILKKNSGGSDSIGLLPSGNAELAELGVSFNYDAEYLPKTETSGTVRGTGYLMSSSYPNDTTRAIYTKTVYADVEKVAEEKALMVYARAYGPGQDPPFKDKPFYRLWNGENWEQEQSALPLQRADPLGYDEHVEIQYVRLVYSPDGKEAILGAQDALGNVWAQKYDASTGQWSRLTLVRDSGQFPFPGHHFPGPQGRLFDVAYERSKTRVGGADVYRAILVCADPDDGGVPLYSVWNGSTWTSIGEWEWEEDHGHEGGEEQWSAGTWTQAHGARVEDVPDAMSQPAFIELATNPKDGSKEVGMIYQDSGGNVYGEVWDGEHWSTMGENNVWARVHDEEARAIGLAYQSDSGWLAFGYGDTSAGYSRIWNGIGLQDEFRFTARSRPIHWLTMNSVPTTDDVVAVYIASDELLWSSTLAGSIAAWSPSVFYDVDDLVTYQGTTYVSIHNSNQNRPPSSETHYWQAIPVWGVVPSWSGTITYHDGDFVTSSGTVYEYIHSHSSAGNAPPNSDYWRTTRVWDQQTTYSESSLVTYQGMTYESIHNHSPNKNKVPSTEHSYWQELPGWGTAIYYEHDLVTFGGVVYEYISDHPSAGNPPTNENYWRVWPLPDPVEVDHGTVYADSSPYFAFASGGADENGFPTGTLVFSGQEDHDQNSSLTVETWTGGSTWTTLGTSPGWTRSYAAIVSSPANTLSGYYNNAPNSNVLEWHAHSGDDWSATELVPLSGYTLGSGAYERLAIAMSAASGFKAVKGTWRESY